MTCRKKNDIMETMSGKIKTGTNIKVDFTRQERDEAKALAKSKGMTFQGFVGQLIKNALRESKEATNG